MVCAPPRRRRRAAARAAARSAAPLAGISLYTPRLNEIAYPQKSWLPTASSARRPSCSRCRAVGARSSSPVWRDFLLYATRAAPPFYDPNAEAQRGAGRRASCSATARCCFPPRARTRGRAREAVHGRLRTAAGWRCSTPTCRARPPSPPPTWSAASTPPSTASPRPWRSTRCAPTSRPQDDAVVGGAPVERSDARVADACAARAALATLPTAAALPVYDPHHRRASLGAVGRTRRHRASRAARRRVHRAGCRVERRVRWVQRVP